MSREVVMFLLGLLIGLAVGGLLAWNLLPQPKIIKDFLDRIWAKIYSKSE